MSLSLVPVTQLRNFGTFGLVVLHKRLLDTNPTLMLSRMYSAYIAHLMFDQYILSQIFP